MTTVFIFKTSIHKRSHIKKVKPLLNHLINKNGSWNFDLEDCDNILRVETQIVKSDTIRDIINNQGFLCEELY